MTDHLELRPTSECRFDCVSLGEVMLRLDPGEFRIRTARRFEAWEGGGEYNVVRGLSRVFGCRGSVITGLVDDEVGRLIEGLILGGGVDASNIRWAPSDGMGRTAYNGLNFTERGFGVRGAVGVSYRGQTAASQLKGDDIDFDWIFGEAGVRWLHTGGIYAALSEESARTVKRAMESAKRHGTVVSYDLNFRPSLWKSRGGREAAQRVNREVAEFVDVMLGNEEDFSAALGFEVEGVDESLTSLPVEGFKKMIAQAADEFPNLKVIATTMRAVTSASRNDWGAIAWSRESGIVEARNRLSLEIIDRVGGGDSFASGLIYGLMEGEPLQTCVEYGAAHGALAMTTPGDTSMASRDEVIRLAGGGNARVIR